MAVPTTTTTLQTTATSGNGSVASYAGDAPRFITVYVVGAGTIAGGTVLIEEAHASDYSGTWDTVATITGTALSGGVVDATHLTGHYTAIRARISVAITGGGTISATAVASY